jgi:hypothetical protein
LLPEGKRFINQQVGDSFTASASPSPGSKRDSVNPYAERKTGHYTFAEVRVLLPISEGVWNSGIFEKFIPQVLPVSKWVKKHEIIFLK